MRPSFLLAFIYTLWHRRSLGQTAAPALHAAQTFRWRSPTPAE